jgi:hypothetical protein
LFLWFTLKYFLDEEAGDNAALDNDDLLDEDAVLAV